jgi:hypothetical protein
MNFNHFQFAYDSASSSNGTPSSSSSLHEETASWDRGDTGI